MYEQGWNKLTQAHYAQSEWPEAETIAPLVQNGTFTLLRLANTHLIKSCSL